MTTLLNSWGAYTFADVDQITLSHLFDQAKQTIAETPDAVLLLEGGEDVHPILYGEQNMYSFVTKRSRSRDMHELALIQAALTCRVPIIGLCRGHQLLAVSQGGTLYQDMYENAATDHLDHHPVQCFGTLRQQYGAILWVNSYHHQAVKRIPSGAIEIARARDGINEGLAYPAINAISVQWHPEFLNDYIFLDWMLARLGVPPMGGIA